MHSKLLTTKLIAVFLVAFVCLNAGGALCVAYCQSTLDSAHETGEHSSLKQKSGHCDPDNQGDDEQRLIVAGGSEMDCCPMTVSFIAGPIEKSSFYAQVPARVLAPVFGFNETAFFSRTSINIPPRYRGPPLDRRISRLMNGVIRI